MHRILEILFKNAKRGVRRQEIRRGVLLLEEMMILAMISMLYIIIIHRILRKCQLTLVILLLQEINFLLVINSAVRGVFAGGYTSSQHPLIFNTIEYVTISTTGDTQDFGDLTEVKDRSAGVSNSTRGIFYTGGTTPIITRVNTIDFITIASTGNATDFGDSLTNSQAGLMDGSSPTRGVFMGGTIPTSPFRINTIEY